MRNLGWRSRMPQAKGSRKFARKNLVFSKTLAALPATRSPGLPTNTVMCQERMMPLSSSACQSGLGRLRQHRQTDQPVGRRLAEVEQPVVVDAIAGGA